MLVKFAKSAFRGFFEALLWLALIGSAIGGMIGGVALIGGARGFIASLIVGTIAGFLTIIIWGCLIATFLNINENIEQMREQLRR